MAKLTQILLQNKHLAFIKNHMEAQVEVCGLIGGVWQPFPKIAVAQMIRPIQNIDAFPAQRFTMSPREQLAAMLEFEKNGWDTIGIYHSHPQGEAKPSASDIAESFYPDVVYLIGVPQGEIRAWRIIKGSVFPVEIHLTP